jgi:hypothetical protein
MSATYILELGVVFAVKALELLSRHVLVDVDCTISGLATVAEQEGAAHCLAILLPWHN